MEIILLENMGSLGLLGDQVEVKAGYGRNFLIPQGKAVPATEKNIAHFEARRNELEAAAQTALSAAQNRAQSLASIESMEIEATAGEEGKLFGSVGTRDIVEALKHVGHEIDKSEVRLPDGPLREVGDHEILLQLHAEVAVIINISVVPASA